MKIDNTLVSLGTCEKCNKPMSVNDFVNIAALRLLEPLKYVCMDCMEAATDNKKTSCSGMMIKANGGIVNVGEIFFNASIDAQKTFYSCSICGYSSYTVDDFMIHSGSVPDFMGKLTENKFYYCKGCVEKYDLREGK